jgi:hypothetical protein
MPKILQINNCLYNCLFIYCYLEFYVLITFDYDSTKIYIYKVCPSKKLHLF